MKVRRVDLGREGNIETPPRPGPPPPPPPPPLPHPELFPVSNETEDRYMEIIKIKSASSPKIVISAHVLLKAY